MSKFGWIVAVVLVLTSCNSATFQVIKHLTPNITDHKIFDKQDLTASATPFQFTQSNNINLPAPHLWIQKASIPEGRTSEEILKRKKCASFLIIRNDSLIYEWYGNGYTRDRYSQVFSVTKSWTSALVGIAIKEGFIKSIHQPVVDYFPEFDDCDEAKKKITIYHLLNMTSGLDFNDYQNLSKLSQLYYCDGSEELACEIKSKYEPGEVWEYKSISTLILGRVIERATGVKYSDYFKEKLWEPLQMENNGCMAEDKEGTAKSYGGLSLTAIDLAKFGRLYLNKGNWNGEQIVPESWVDSLRNRNFSHGVWNYSYQWWLDTYPRKAKYEANDYFAGGYKGQICYVNPDENLVIVRLGKREAGVNWPQSLSKLALLLSQPKGIDTKDWLAEVSGSYETEKGRRKMKIRLKDGKVIIEKNNEYFELIKETAYSYVDLKNDVKLLWNAKDEMHGFFLEQGDIVQYFHKSEVVIPGSL